MITKFKFYNKLLYGKIFSQLLLEKINDKPNLPQAIMPIPLHSKRLRQRGFNQALELAKPLAKKLKLPLLSTHCKRHKATKVQSKLPAKKRSANTKDAFSLTQPISYSHIAIIDDVITTGNTVNEVSRLLKKAGVKNIEIWCIAKTDLN